MTLEPPEPDIFSGSSDIARLAREVDWAATSLGPVGEWPAALKTVVAAVLESPFPINLWCGPELVLIYNEAYGRVLGVKHPHALGQPGPQVWREIWGEIAPMFEQIRRGGDPVYADDAPFVVRRGEPASAWFTFALSAVRDDGGNIVAFLNIVSESTGRVLAERAREAALVRAERAESRLLDIFRDAPAFMAVLRGSALIFEYANRAYFTLVGHRELLGLPLLEALPELRGQGFETLLRRVVEEGEPYVGREVAVELSRGPEPDTEQRFVDFVYYPMTNPEGIRDGVVAHGYDVTEHVLARQEAQRSRVAAEEANRAKSQFLANMSHEIRTPINAVMGYAELLTLGLDGTLSTTQQSHVERIRASSRHLLSLVEDLLDVSRLEAGRLSVRPERVSVARTAGEACAVIEGQAAQRGIDVRNECAADEPHYFGDEDRVRQILLNLLTNAVKFTAAGGTVRITCGSSPAHADVEGGGLTWIAVSDTGIGIERDQLERIFRPFTQVEAGHTRSYGGTGLGLNISRQLARLMDGDLTVVSEPGRGSRFTLWLPGSGTPAPTLDEIVQAELSEGRPQSLAAVAEVLQEEMHAIVQSFADRLRATLPAARGLGFGDLADHSAALIADMSQSLLILETGRAIPERLLQDGSEIQRLIADLHGRQRAQLGWHGDDLAREWQILRDEIATAIEVADLPGADRDAGIRLLLRMIDRAEQIATRALEHARSTGTLK